MELKQMNRNIFEQFDEASLVEEYHELRTRFEQGGYSLFSQLLTSLKEHLMICDEQGLEQATKLIEKGKVIIPQPVIISPSWEKVWSEMEKLIYYKGEALRSIPRSERTGEWQIIMDNPYTNEGISCYPALTFDEAAYLYGYFRKDLRKNEYIRMQKIVNVIMANGE
jgi:hypothetical protein